MKSMDFSFLGSTDYFDQLSGLLRSRINLNDVIKPEHQILAQINLLIQGMISPDTYLVWNIYN